MKIFKVLFLTVVAMVSMLLFTGCIVDEDAIVGTWESYTIEDDSDGTYIDKTTITFYQDGDFRLFNEYSFEGDFGYDGEYEVEGTYVYDGLTKLVVSFVEDGDLYTETISVSIVGDVMTWLDYEGDDSIVFKRK